ncbi:GMC oxidoreductase [Paenibacillus arenilitoris]|uniref:LysM peptidoglycan-binding domain-containing protein n=1 Tax=Paenibacillus arenilitoris TaxID=2772299 RepID=A0A927H853_9BACL|nr:GMC oxidoreductase [Paenibacillus arenilitoris]MBD2870274.1 LysM peptidoglycan-binding domain-containing protein [Paenibacillus arenilitoris]
MRRYVATNGDTPGSIANRYGIEERLLLEANPHIRGSRAITAGTPVQIPELPSAAAAGTLFTCPPAEPFPYLNSWVPLTPIGQMQEAEYDVLIIGTGMGGGAALWRLCQQWADCGKKIGVIEKGGLLLQTHSWNVPTLNNERAGRLFANPAVAYPIGRTLPQFPGAREVYALGGRTAFWGTVSPRLRRSDFTRWPISYEEMEPYYNIAETVMKISKAYSEDSTITETLLERLWMNGYPEATNSPMAVNHNPTKYGEVAASAAFSSIDFVAKALNLAPFDLAIGACATRIFIEGGRVAAIEAKAPGGTPYYLRAKTVIVAASALQAPRLLLHSRIPGRAIGHYLSSHSFVVTNGLLRAPTLPEVMGTLAILVPATEEHPYQVQIQGPGPYYWYHDTDKMIQEEWGFNFFGGFGMVEPRFENRVYLEPGRPDENGMPNIGVSFSYGPRDYAVIEQLQAAIPRIASAAGIQLTGPEGRPDLCLLPPGADFHEHGTCRMGDNPATSATDRYGQIHGVAGLYAAGNCVLPSIGAANPSLTAAAAAIRTADHIVRTQRA